MFGRVVSLSNFQHCVFIEKLNIRIADYVLNFCLFISFIHQSLQASLARYREEKAKVAEMQLRLEEALREVSRGRGMAKQLDEYDLYSCHEVSFDSGCCCG